MLTTLLLSSWILWSGIGDSAGMKYRRPNFPYFTKEWECNSTRRTALRLWANNLEKDSQIIIEGIFSVDTMDEQIIRGRVNNKSFIAVMVCLPDSIDPNKF